MSTHKMRMDERNAICIKSDLYDSASLSKEGPLAPPVRGEHVSLGNHVIEVHTHFKDAHGRKEHDVHKIRPL